MRLFNEMQVARFNVIYYQTRASRMRQYSTWSNVLATVTSSVAFVGLFSASTDLGTNALKGLTAFAAIAALLGPVLHWDSKGSQFDRAALGHSIIMDRLRLLLSDLKVSDAVEPQHQSRIAEIEALRGALTALDEPGKNRVKLKAWKQAEEELPTSHAWDLV